MTWNNKKIGLFLMTEKGLTVLKTIIENFGASQIAFVVSSKDESMACDFFDEIVNAAKFNNIPLYMKNENPNEKASIVFAISWRWMINPSLYQKVIVFHDSLLPKYRGFSPLVSALINGEKILGVTAIFATDEYDKGEIINQDSIVVTYPLLIKDAIQALTESYRRLAIHIINKIREGNLISYKQNEADATYSLWRNSDDYFIDWSWDAERIKRFIDAVGFPYQGALSNLDSEVLRISKCVVCDDIKIENRVAGKVIFIENNYPIVVCGKAGLIKILEMTKVTSQENALPLKKFRSKFY
jgi:methionyl-tRNA formyltransferase